MKVFAIDTSTPRVVACYIDEEVKVLAEVESGAKHATHIHRIVKMFDGVDFGSLDIVGIGIGPGGLTGLRVGISFATALGIGKKFVEINSLELIGYNAAFYDGYVVVLRKARQGYLYGAVYLARGTGELEEVRGPFIQSIEAVGEMVAEFNPKVFLGDGGEFFRKESVLSDWNLPRADNLAILVKKKIEAGQFVKLVEPLYLQKSIAELNFEKRKGRS